MKNTIIIILFLGLFASCEVASTSSSNKVVHYNLKEVLNKQIDLLLSKEAVLYKFSIVNDEGDTVKIQPDSLRWGKEFELFFAADINEPALMGSYSESIENDESSNLSVLVFQSLEEDLKVKELKVYYLNDLKAIKKITADYDASQLAVSAKTRFELSFEEIHNQNLLTSYRVEGYHNMMGTDSLGYTVNAKIEIKE